METVRREITGPFVSQIGMVSIIRKKTLEKTQLVVGFIAANLKHTGQIYVFRLSEWRNCFEI